MANTSKNGGNIREQLLETVAGLDHILPGQPPLKDFVHHNTLHAYEHLSFPEALAEARKLTGIYGYLPEERFRELYAQGRITDGDLIQVLDKAPDLDAVRDIFTAGGRSVRARDIYLLGLLYPFKRVTGSQFAWQTQELAAMERFQADVPGQIRRKALGSSGRTSEKEFIVDLWSACLHSLALDHYVFHPEELMDLSPDQAESIISAFAEYTGTEDERQSRVHRQMRIEAESLLNGLLKRVGKDYTLRGMLLALTGEDLLDDIRPYLIRHLGNHLDLGVAAWHSSDREQGFYTNWRNSASSDLAWVFEDFPDWHDMLAALPDDALDAVISELTRLGLPEAGWAGYLERLALELPGWSGMFLWRHANPGYNGLASRVEMLDYLAVRLILERVFAQRLCRRAWNIGPDLGFLRGYFRDNRSEFLVRYALFNFGLPEYAVNRAHRLISMVGGHRPERAEWRHVAHIVWTWRHSPAADRVTGHSIDCVEGHSVYGSGWRLFRLAQHLGLSGEQIRALSREQVEDLLICLDRLIPDKTGFLWLQAYENHYRDRVFNAVSQNHGRGRWKTRERRPQAQIVFCMDDREEGIRRHLEEHNPAIETLGAAGFFGVAINWRALDDETPTALCPVVVTPAHEVRETVGPEGAALKPGHDKRRRLRLGLGDLLLNDTRHNLFTGAAGTVMAAPAALLALMAKVLAPLKAGEMAHRFRHAIEPPVPTLLALTAEDDGSQATPEHNRAGFIDTEQADRVQNFLRTIGLTSGFAPLVVMMGHGSVSRNNPHLAAYDCGACSGRHGGPNARVFAAMANRPEIRSILRGRGIDIPDDTWFLGAMHNTCDESIQWYDRSSLPAKSGQAFKDLIADLDVARRGSAHERCRKFASAPESPGIDQAFAHAKGRSRDFSQARPELGHATNAVAFIGRRSLSQGAFFDRRSFLISYDPSADPEGSVVENILLNAGPVGAGINLEYYFSTVNNEHYGCSSKVTHNVTGFFGIMDGAESDLRTGLPLQMIEIHEAMRLQVLVEAKMDVLTAIYQRQPPLQQLVGNGWLLLSAKDPDSADIHVFEPQQGWIPWKGEEQTLAAVDSSVDWYRGHRDHLPPTLIRQPAEVQHG